MCDDPKIYTCCAVCRGKENLKGSPSEELVEMNMNVLIRDLWIQGMDIIDDIRVRNTDATSYQSKSPNKYLKTAEKTKNKNYLDAFLKQH